MDNNGSEHQNLRQQIIAIQQSDKSPEEKNKLIFKIALSAASKFHRLIDPSFKKQKNNSIFIYKKNI